MKRRIRTLLFLAFAAMLMGVDCLPTAFWYNKFVVYTSYAVDTAAQLLVQAATNPSP
jgi:hypothetical protein